MDYELMAQALLERMGQMTVQYEKAIAELRATLTRMEREKDAAKKTTKKTD